MNRQEFLEKLRARLSDMDEQDQADALRYFDELIQDKAADAERPEEDIIREMGSVDVIAATVLEGAAHKERRAQAPLPETEPAGVIRTLTTNAAQVRDIRVAAHDIAVRIKAGAADEVVVSYPQDEDYQFDVSLQNGLLELTRRKDGRFRFFRFDLWALGIGAAMEITLTLPREYAGMLDVRTSNSPITMNGVHVWGALKLLDSNARIEVSQCQAREMAITTSNARMLAEDIAARGVLALKTSNGRIAAERLTADGDLTLQTGNARINAQGLQSGGILALQTSNGPIQADALDAMDIRMKTSNGAIEGKLMGSAADYSVMSSTPNGKNSLAGHTGRGPRQLSAHTSNAGIRLRFERD